MPREKLSMRKLVEVLRLSAKGLSHRQIAASCGVARSTVAAYLDRMAQAGLSWPLDAAVTSETLEQLLYPGEHPGVRGRDESRPEPDWCHIHRELKRKAVTLKRLWREYSAEQPTGYAYSQFCERYRRWARTVDVTMRQNHPAGERLFVDFAGMTIPVYDARGGVQYEAQIFVAALGASHYLYAQALASQRLPDWIAAHVHTFEHLQGVPEIVVPDNLKSAVTRACRYEPDVNPTYQHMAAHYGVAILPGRPRHPRDKAKAETGVQIVERDVLAVLRDRRFLSLFSLNQAIWALIEQVNRRPFQKLDGCRYSLFKEIDQPALMPLPSQRYEYAEIRKVRANIDYHVEISGHYYSVPFSLARKQLDARVTAATVEVLHQGQRVAVHPRSHAKGRHTTEHSHMPKAHQKSLEWTPSRLIHWAGTIGPHSAQMVEKILQGRPHPEQGYRSALGLMRLAKTYTEERLEAACRRALKHHLHGYKHVLSILKARLDQQPQESADIEQQPPCPLHHENIRGAAYYATETT